MKKGTHYPILMIVRPIYTSATHLVVFLAMLHMACGVFILQPGIEPAPPVEEVWSLNHQGSSHPWFFWSKSQLLHSSFVNIPICISLKIAMCVPSCFSCVQPLDRMDCGSLQAPLSPWGFSRARHWRGLPRPPGYFPDPGSNPRVSYVSCIGMLFTTGTNWKPLKIATLLLLLKY